MKGLKLFRNHYSATQIRYFPSSGYINLQKKLRSISHFHLVIERMFSGAVEDKKTGN